MVDSLGIGELNLTRKAIASDKDSEVICPGDMLSESPDTAELASAGKPQSGPLTRGNKRNSNSIIGNDCRMMTPARRVCANNGIGAASRLAAIRAEVIITSETIIKAATPMVCE